MAYEVTKRIKGHDYRYRVEGYRDPASGGRKTRWEYLGAVTNDGIKRGGQRRRAPVKRDEIIEATAQLLKHRDPTNVTVAVIVRHAGISHSSFYRYFPNRRSVFNAALAHIVNETILALPPLDAPLADQGEARERLRRWSEAYYRSALQQRALRWAMAQRGHARLRARIERSLIRVDTAAVLGRFFKRLNDAGLAHVEDSAALGSQIRAVHAALLFAAAVREEDEEFKTPRLDDVYPVIERAVFGSP